MKIVMSQHILGTYRARVASKRNVYPYSHNLLEKHTVLTCVI